MANRRQFTQEEKDILMSRYQEYCDYPDRSPERNKLLDEVVRKLATLGHAPPGFWNRTNARQWMINQKHNKNGPTTTVVAVLQDALHPGNGPPREEPKESEESDKPIDPPVDPVEPDLTRRDTPPGILDEGVVFVEKGVEGKQITLADVPEVPKEDQIDPKMMRKEYYAVHNKLRRFHKLIMKEKGLGLEQRMEIMDEMQKRYVEAARILARVVGKHVPFQREEMMADDPVGVQRTSSIDSQVLNSSHCYMNRNNPIQVNEWVTMKEKVTMSGPLAAVYEGTLKKENGRVVESLSGVVCLKFVDGEPVYVRLVDKFYAICRGDVMVATGLFGKPTHMAVAAGSVFVAGDSRIRRFNVESLEVMETMYVGDDELVTSMVVWNGVLVAAVSGRIVTWKLGMQTGTETIEKRVLEDLDETKVDWIRGLPGAELPFKVQFPENAKITSLAIVKDHLVCASIDYEVGLVYNSSGALVQYLMGHTLGISFLCPGPEPGQILSGSLDLCMRLWNLETPVISLFGAHSDKITCITVTKDGIACSGCADSVVCIWNVHTPRLVCKVSTDGLTPSEIHFSLATNELQIWAVSESRSELQKFTFEQQA